MYYLQVLTALFVCACVVLLFTDGSDNESK
jgi:hypothetical protein